MFDQLNTGTAAPFQTFGNEELDATTEETISQEQLEVEQLLPSVKQILTVIDEEIDAISDIRAYMKTLGAAPNPEDIQAEYRGRELYIEFLTTLKGNIASKLGDVEVTE